MSGPRVVALGDSVTFGVGDAAPRGSHPGWAGHLATMLGASSFTNLARTGARMRDVLAEQARPAVAAAPDLATLLVGGNDVLRDDFAPERVAAEAREAAVVLTGAGAVVLCVLLHDPAQVLPRGSGVFGRVIARRATALNEALEASLGDLAGVVLLDPRLDDSTHRRSLWHVDRMHPSPEGHRSLARQAAHAIEGRGFPTCAHPPQIPSARPGPAAVALWLVINGVPWFAKRSTDLVPELIRVVIHDARAEREESRRQARVASASQAPATPTSASRNFSTFSVGVFGSDPTTRT